MACENCKCKKRKWAESIINRIPNKAYEEIEYAPYVKARKFSKDVNELDLQWHFDEEDREIKVLKSSVGWKFQFDNELPFSLEENDTIFIPAKTYHRILKNSALSDLIVYINKS
jgi:hypothetical protein